MQKYDNKFRKKYKTLKMFANKQIIGFFAIFSIYNLSSG